MKELFKDFRILILILSLILSIIFINPHYENVNGKIVLTTNIKQGLDLKGGTRLLVEPVRNITSEELSGILSVLESRISSFGLKEAKIRPVFSLNKKYVQIEVAELNVSRIKNLVESQGKFEARISVEKKDNDVLKLGNREYVIHVINNSVIVENRSYGVNDSFTLNSGKHDINVEVKNISDGSANLSLLAFSGMDVTKVFRDAQNSRVFPSGNLWRFEFQILIRNDAAERFKDIVQDLSVIRTGTGSYLSSDLELYLDDKFMDSLRIAATFKENVVKNPLITGSGNTKEDAVNKMKSLQAIIESGNLPSKLRVVSVNTISPLLGKKFVNESFLAVLLAILSVGLIIFLRYKRPKIVLPIIITAISEIIIILGIASLINWTIDLAAIAGIIAAVGTGVDDQIVITDERFRKRKEYLNLSAKIRRAFFIIWTAFSTTVVAMLPLTFVGASAMIGFALTTILGVSIGVFITRPAYARILNYIEKE